MEGEKSFRIDPGGRQAEKIPKGEIPYFTEPLENEPECVLKRFCLEEALLELVQGLESLRC